MNGAASHRDPRVGVVHYAAFPNAWTDAAEYRRTVELLFDDPAIQVVELSTVIPAIDVGSIAADARASGTTLLLSAGPRLMAEGAPSLADPASASRAIALVQQWLDLANRLGAVNLMLASGTAPRGASPLDVRRRLVDVLVDLSERAARSGGAEGPTLSLETYSSIARPLQAIGPTAVAIELQDAVQGQTPGFHLTVDIAHLAQLGEDVLRSVSAIGHRLRHLHVSTSVLVPGHARYGDQHPPFRHPEVAITRADLEVVVEHALRVATHPIVLSAEVRPLPDEDAEALWAQTRRDLLGIVEHGRQAAQIARGHGSAEAVMEAQVV